MLAYIYQAALLCEECVIPLKRGLADIGKEDNGDSDTFPQGPYSNGGGEADCPQHCDHCNVFLENPLTSDGMEYVRATIERDAKVYGIGIEDICSSIALEEWAPFYGIPLEEKEKEKEKELEKEKRRVPSGYDTLGIS